MPTDLDKLIEAYDSATDESKCACVTYFGKARLAIMENARAEQAALVTMLRSLDDSGDLTGPLGSELRQLLKRFPSTEQQR